MSVSRLFGEGEAEISSFSRPAAREFLAEGFVVCPLPIHSQGAAAGWMQNVYQIAYERAKACVQPPWHERNLFVCMN